ncbi:uncharacterized protein NECHADRAFT_49614, partial [Fusarium vanettenii 77-13-4]
RLMFSASNMPTPNGASDYSKPISALLLPGFIVINNIVPKNVNQLIDLIEASPTTLSPLAASTLPAIRPHEAIILLCSQRSRDARCGQSAPLLRKEFERHLRPLGLYRNMNDERPGGVGICFISHLGGHKYSANVMHMSRRGGEVGAAQCIWLARVRPEDCENLVRYTVLQEKVVKPEHQLRGGFDRVKGVTSW